MESVICLSTLTPALDPLPASWECDLVDNSLRWSTGVYDLFGLARGTGLEREATVAMYLPESRAELDRLRRAAIKENGSFTFEARIRRADAAIRWIRVTADVACEGGVARYLYGSKVDVTDEMTLRRAA